MSYLLTANGGLPGGSGYTIRHNKQIIQITQNNTTIKRNTAHKTTHTIKDTLHRMHTVEKRIGTSAVQFRAVNCEYRGVQVSDGKMTS
jgi:hypothetical protein